MRNPRLWPLAFSIFAAACASSPDPLPSLRDYTGGACALTERVRTLFDAQGDPAGGVDPGSNVALTALARRWRDAAGPGARVDLWVTDFPPRPRPESTMRIRICLEAPAAGGPPGERVYEDASFDLRLARAAGNWTLLGSRPAGVLPEIRRGRPHLQEVAAEIGLGDARNETLDPVEATNICVPATHHHPGVALADFDGDGADDILLPSRHPRLFLNDGHGSFREVTKGSGLDGLPPGEAAGAVAADLDGDGLPEIFLTANYTPCRLLHNDGGGHFHDITAESGLAGLTGSYTSAVLFDADGDGRLDLFLASYGDARDTGPAYNGKNAPGNRFFHNVGNGGSPFFVDETRAAGFGDRGWGFAASACDFDFDGDDDLYVANDFGTNCLYENVSEPGRPRFREIARRAGVLDDGYGMGVAWGDADGDGRFDLHIADFSSPYRWLIRSRLLPMPPVPGIVQAIARPIVVPMLLRRCEGDGLYLNEGAAGFRKASEEAGVVEGGWAWGTEFVDLDGDGRQDIVVVNGMWQAGPGGRDDEVGFWNAMSSEGIAFHDGYWGGIDFGGNGMASHTAKHIYRNLGGARFEEDAFLQGFDTRADARGLAIGDLDGDGAPEIVVATFRGPLLVYRNGWTGAARITLRLRAKSPGNRDAVGAVVRLRAGGRTQVREVRAGSSYLSQSSLAVHFGLGEAARAEEIEVQWPDGTREVRRDVPGGARLVWTEGDGGS